MITPTRTFHQRLLAVHTHILPMRVLVVHSISSGPLEGRPITIRLAQIDA
jgi:hypothetical protein